MYSDDDGSLGAALQKAAEKQARRPALHDVAAALTQMVRCAVDTVSGADAGGVSVTSSNTDVSHGAGAARVMAQRPSIRDLEQTLGHIVASAIETIPGSDADSISMTEDSKDAGAHRSRPCRLALAQTPGAISTNRGTYDRPDTPGLAR
jgi:hypothetical protein